MPNDLLWIVIVAIAVRVLVIFVFHTYRIDTGPIGSDLQNYKFGYEMGRIGRAIAQGEGFSNIYHRETGPTSWEPPLYPYLIGGVFKILGVYSQRSAIVLLTFNSICSGLTCIPIFLIARQCFGQKAGLTSAWIWALNPWVFYWCSYWVWETSLSTLLLAVLIWLTLTMEEREGYKCWIQFGVLWAVTVLSNPSFTSFLPVSGLWAAYGCAKRNKRWLWGAVTASLLFCACIMPWEVRNYREFGRFIYVRGDFGALLRMGNGPGARGLWMFDLMPSRNDVEFAKYARMGEVAYAAERRQEAMQFIEEDPWRFLVLCGKRFVYFWGGNPHSPVWQTATLGNLFEIATAVICFWGLVRSIRKRVPGAWLFFWLILLYPPVYYITYANVRYRHPLEPYIVILGVSLIVNREDENTIALTARDDQTAMRR